MSGNVPMHHIRQVSPCGHSTSRLVSTLSSSCFLARSTRTLKYLVGLGSSRNAHGTMSHKVLNTTAPQEEDGIRIET